MTTITPFHKNGRYTDIRVCMRDMMERFAGARAGIVILFDDDGMHCSNVCKSSEMAYAAANLLVKATTDEDEVDVE